MVEPSRIYKIAPASLWESALGSGLFDGAPVDLADGYIHFSTASQVRETARRHFAGQGDLLLIEVETAVLGDDLKWEPSRGGDLFPHLYAPLPVSAVTRVDRLTLGPDGHIFPDDLP